MYPFPCTHGNGLDYHYHYCWLKLVNTVTKCSYTLSNTDCLKKVSYSFEVIKDLVTYVAPHVIWFI